MHILIIPSWYPNINSSLSGIFFKEQAEAIANQNLKVGCIAINESALRYILSSEVKSFAYTDELMNNVQTMSLVYPSINRLKRLRAIIRKQIFKILFKNYIRVHGRPDIVHLHSFFYGDLALWIKKKYNINYVVTEHSTAFARGLLSRRELDFANEVFKNSSHNIAVSSEFRHLLKRQLNINFDFIPNMVNTDFFSLKANKSNSNFVFVNIAFLGKKKNQSMLIEAFYKAFSDNKKVKLIIVGDGEEYDRLNVLIKNLNLQPQVTLYGRANRNEIKDLLQSSNAFVLSSKVETFGVVIIEAMSCGLPVVSTKSGGPESIITNNKLGELVENSSDSLAKGMFTIFNSTYNKEYIRAYTIRNFSKEAICDKLIQIYKVHEKVKD